MPTDIDMIILLICKFSPCDAFSNQTNKVIYYSKEGIPQGQGLPLSALGRERLGLLLALSLRMKIALLNASRYKRRIEESASIDG